MAFKLVARTRELTSTTGTGALTLAGAASSNNVAFSAGLSVGDTTYIAILSGNGTDWEECEATYSGTNTLTRGNVIANSLGTTAHISLTGTSVVFCHIPLDLIGCLARLGLQSWHRFVDFATTAALAANTYNNGTSGVGATLTANSNGALSVDSNTPVVGNRILVKDEATLAHNGIYVVTQVGDGSHPYILTRADDHNSALNMSPGDAVAVALYSGAANAITLWVANVNSTPVVVGTTHFNFVNIAPVMVGDSGSGGTKGLVPAPGAGDAAAGKFLKADGTWAAPSSGSGGLFAGSLSSVPTSAGTGLTTWRNQGASTTVTDSANGITIFDVSSGSAENTRVRNKAAPATPYTIFGLIAVTSDMVSNHHVVCWIGWDDGTKLLGLGVHANLGTLNSLDIIEKTNVTTDGGSSGVSGTTIPPMIWVAINDDGSSLHMGWSADGANFIRVYDHTYAGSFFGAQPNKVAFCLNPFASRCYGTLLSWTVSATNLP